MPAALLPISAHHVRPLRNATMLHTPSHGTDCPLLRRGRGHQSTTARISTTTWYPPWMWTAHRCACPPLVMSLPNVCSIITPPQAPMSRLHPCVPIWAALLSSYNPCPTFYLSTGIYILFMQGVHPLRLEGGVFPDVKQGTHPPTLQPLP